MATITPDEGRNWYRDRALSTAATDDQVVYDVAVGTGSASLSTNDTQLDNEIYRGNPDDYSNISVQSSSTVGRFVCRITVSGGTEVPADTDITELGVWARDPSIAEGSVTDGDDVLLYRELRGAVTIASGDRTTFEIRIDVKDT